MPNKRFSAGRVGGLEFHDFNSIAHSADLVDANAHRLNPKRGHQRNRHRIEFDAILIDSELVLPNTWRYKWYEAIWDNAQKTFVELVGGFKSTAVFDTWAWNSLEADNDGVGVEGVGVDINGTPGVTITMLPVVKSPAALAVTMTARSGLSGLVYTFSVVNAYKITCTEPPQ